MPAPLLVKTAVKVFVSTVISFSGIESVATANESNVAGIWLAVVVAGAVATLLSTPGTLVESVGAAVPGSCGAGWLKNDQPTKMRNIRTMAMIVLRSNIFQLLHWVIAAGMQRVATANSLEGQLSAP